MNTKNKNFLTGRVLTSILFQASVVLALVSGVMNCSGGSGIFSKSSFSASTTPIQVPVAMVYQPAGVNLEGRGDGLGLVSTGTSPVVTVSSCASGYTLANFTITSGVVNLYNGDRNCTVALHSFSFQSFTYTDTNDGAVAWNGTTAGSYATFSKVAASSTAADLIKVYIGTQVTSPVTTSSSIVFNFTDISAGATANVGQSSVSTAVPLSVSGRPSPNYGTPGGILYTRYLSTNSNGSGNMSFTVSCATTVTGSPADATSACPNPSDTAQTSDVQSTMIKYILVPDLYSACKIAPTTLTVSNANSIFASPPQGTVVKSIPATASAITGGGADGQIGAASADNYANSVTNGGFDTPSIITGSTPIYSGASVLWTNGYQYLNNLLILQRLDASANTLSYLYYCVDLAAITQD